MLVRGVTKGIKGGGGAGHILKSVRGSWREGWRKQREKHILESVFWTEWGREGGRKGKYMDIMYKTGKLMEGR